jgi:hypothetical protein
VEIEESMYANALSVGLNGTVYLLDASSYPTQDSIFEVDMEFGTKTFLNSLNRVSVYTDSEYPQSMITDPMTGVLYILSTSNGNYYTLNSFDPASNLVATYDMVGEVTQDGDDWWAPYVGNTYSALISLDTHVHLYITEAVAVEDACEHYEAVSRKCLYCGDVITVINGHNYELVDSVAPGCVDGGYDLYACACGATKQENFVAALGHSEELTNEASCTAFAEYTCSVCGNVRVDMNSLLEHDMVLIQEANCMQVDIYECSVCEATEEGWYRGDHTNPDPENTADCTAGYECSVCFEYVSGYSRHCYELEILDPVCDDEGARKYSCVRCEAVVSFTLEAPGHMPGAPTVENYVGTACVVDGSYNHVVRCEICQDILEIQTMSIPADGHSFVDSSVEATCTTEGYATLTCEVCGYKCVTETIAPLGHTEEIIPGTAATCTEAGLTEGKVCSVCDEILVAQEEIAALGHDYESVVTAPNCIDGGYTTHTCRFCGHAYRDSYTEMRAHKFDVVTVVVEPTCTTLGSRRVDCSYEDCDSFYFANNVIPTTAHTEETIPGFAATCTEAGLTDGVKCADCGKILVAQEEIAATGHTFGQWTVSKEATRTEAGEQTRSCACGETETREIPKIEGVNAAVVVVAAVAGLGVAAAAAFVLLKKKR